jgi:hypothetical protein
MAPAMTAGAIRSDWVGRVIDGRFTLLKWLGGSGWSGVFLTELQEPRSRKAQPLAQTGHRAPPYEPNEIQQGSDEISVATRIAMQSLAQMRNAALLPAPNLSLGYKHRAISADPSSPISSQLPGGQNPLAELAEFARRFLLHPWTRRLSNSKVRRQFGEGLST